LAFLTNFRTVDNKRAENYSSRGHLILEFVKIGDDTIKPEDKMFQTLKAYENEGLFG